MSLIEDLYEVRENIRRGQTDDWDADMVTAAIRALEAVQPSFAATETVNAVFPTALCEADPDDDAYCAYHHVWHGQPGDDTV